MWFNRKLHEEPYQVLTSCANPRDRAFPSGTQLTGGAWSSSARVVRCWGWSPQRAQPLLLVASIKLGTLVRKLPVTNREGRWGRRQDHHAPYDLGYTRATMDGTTSRELARASKSLKTDSQFGLQAANLACTKSEIASNRGSAHAAVNTFPGLVHTARHTMRVCNTQK